MPGVSITIDCHDPRVLVPFWCRVLGYVPEPPPGGHATWIEYWRSLGIPEAELEGAEDAQDSIIDPQGHRPRIWFQVVPEAKIVKNRVHLDVDVTDRRSLPLSERRTRVDDMAQELVHLGATLLRNSAPEGADYYAAVLADPEGNEFCIS
jgi:hypothetical protein